MRLSSAHLRGFILGALFWGILTGSAQAASWSISQKDGSAIAITPNHQMMLKMQKPRDGIWGKLYINLSQDQVNALKQYRLDKYFAFISVGIEVDGYTRDANAKVVESQNFVRIEIDQRMWESLKKGSKFVVTLPDGSTFKETLRGSSRAIQTLEREIFRNY